MALLALSFVFALVLLFLYFQSKSEVPTVSLPFVEEKLTATPFPSPTTIPSGPLYEIEADLKMIEKDIDKMKEDTRFTPPEFLFDLGLEP